MSQPHTTHLRVLAIAPSTRGFGFAVLEGDETLVDWGVKSVEGDKNARCLVKLNELIGHYEPRVLVLHDHSNKSSRCSTRIRTLSRRMIALGVTRKVSVKVLSHEEVKRVYFPNGQGTKHALAETLAQRFPEELGFRLPPKRRPWMSEDSRMNIFAAVGLAVALRLRKAKQIEVGSENSSLP